MTTRETILEVLAGRGHGEHSDAVSALIQPQIKIIASPLAPRPAGFRRAEGEDPTDAAKAEAMDRALGELKPGASRFGGVPDLPPGVAWPDRDGVPMEFIAQIRLADVAGLDPLHRLPPTGSLLFFYNSQWSCSDMEKEARCCAVIFHDGPDDQLVRATPPQVEWKSEFSDVTQVAPMIHGMAALRFESTLSLPSDSSPWIGPPLRDFWYAFRYEADPTAEPGEAPYHANYLLGYVDAQDYVDAHVNGTDDQLLLQVDSEDAAEFQFGDCDKLFFMLSKQELAARDFSNVRIYSQLG
jgi:uncharacterized protein YwqG